MAVDFVVDIDDVSVEYGAAAAAAVVDVVEMPTSSIHATNHNIVHWRGMQFSALTSSNCYYDRHFRHCR